MYRSSYAAVALAILSVLTTCAHCGVASIELHLINLDLDPYVDRTTTNTAVCLHARPHKLDRFISGTAVSVLFR